jgi:hypothetical protein
MRPEEYCFTDDLLRFTDKSLDWCCQESDRAARNVADAVQILSEEANRIANMSTESTLIVKTLKNKIDEVVRNESSVFIISDLIDILEEIAKGHSEIEGIINPIVEALQFQDRLTQNFRNHVKMIATWMEFRENVKNMNKLDEADLIEFGTRLSKCTTMAEERAVLKKHIPALSFDELSRDEVGLF